MSKQNLRAYYRAQRHALSDATQLQHAHQASFLLQQLPEWQNWQHVAFYWPHDSELSLLSSLSLAIQEGKSCYLPALNEEGDLSFKACTLESSMRLNTFGIPEPETALCFPPEKLDCVLLPMVSFDSEGNRLGRGKGYFDKTFAFKRWDSAPLLIGVAHECQRAAKLKPEAWDIPLNGILTEAGYYRIMPA